MRPEGEIRSLVPRHASKLRASSARSGDVPAAQRRIRERWGALWRGYSAEDMAISESAVERWAGGWFLAEA